MGLPLSPPPWHVSPANRPPSPGSGLKPRPHMSSWSRTEEKAEALGGTVSSPGPHRREGQSQGRRLDPSAWGSPVSHVGRAARPSPGTPPQEAARAQGQRDSSPKPLPKGGDPGGPARVPVTVWWLRRALGPWGWAAFMGQEPGAAFQGTKNCPLPPTAAPGDGAAWWGQLLLRPVLAGSQRARLSLGGGGWQEGAGDWLSLGSNAAMPPSHTEDRRRGPTMAEPPAPH